MAQVGQLSVVLSAKIQKFKTEMTRAEKHVIAFQQKISKLDAGIQKFSKVAGAGFAIGTVIGIKKAVDSFADFERGMIRVGAVSNTIGTVAFDSMKDSARELAAQTEFSAGQVADAMGFMAQAGFQANQIMAATPSVLSLASAAQLDVARAADITTNIMSGFQLQVGELAKVNDTLVAAMTGANVNLSQLGQSFKFAGTVAKGAGLEFNEVAAAFGLMGNAGLQASMAGTGLRGAVSRLINPSKEQAAVMSKFGLNTEVSSGKVSSLLKIIQKLEKGGANTADMMKLFGQRAGPAMSVLVGQGSDALETFTRRLERARGITQRIAEEQLRTLSGQFKILKSGVEEAKISLGEGLLPALNTLLPVLKQSAEFAGFLFKALAFNLDTGPNKAINDAAENMSLLRREITKLEGTRARIKIEGPSNAAEAIERINKRIARLKIALREAGADGKSIVKQVGKLGQETSNAESEAEKLRQKWEKIRKARERFAQLQRSAAEAFQLSAAGGEKEKAVISLGFGAKRELDELAKSFKEGRLKNDELSMSTDDVRDKVIIGIEKMLATTKTLGEMDQIFAGLATMTGVLTSEQKDELFANKQMFEQMLMARGIAEKWGKALEENTDSAIDNSKEIEKTTVGLRTLGEDLSKSSIGDLIKGFFSVARGSFKNIGIGPGFSKILGDNIGNVLDGASLTESIGSIIGGSVAKAFKLDAGIGAAIGKSIGGLAGVALEGLGSMVSSFFQTAAEAISTLANVFSDAFGAGFKDERTDAVMSALGGLAFAIGFIASTIVGILTPFFGIGILLAPLIAGLAFLTFTVAGLAVTIGLLSQDTKSFQRFQEAFRAALDKITIALEPLFAKLLPLVGVVDLVTEAFASLFADLIDAFELGFLFNVFKQLGIFAIQTAIALGHLTNFIGGAIQGISGAFALFADIFDDVGARIELMALNLQRQIDMLTGQTTPESLQEFAEAVADASMRLGSPSSEAGDAIRNFGDVAGSNVVNIDSLSEALSTLTNLSLEDARIRAEQLLKNKELNESLTNIPQGFKVAQARFRAIGVGEGGFPAATTSTFTGGGTTIGSQTIVINLETDADNFESLIADIQVARETDNELKFGTMLSDALQGNGSGG